MPGRTPAISVVIPTKNRHSMLAEAIASVLRQDFDDYEIVVVDDGVGAAEFVAEWFAAERCRPLRRQRRGRPGSGAQSRRVAGAGRDRRLPRRRRPLGLEVLSFGGARGDRRAIRPRRSPRAMSSSSTTTSRVLETIPFAASTSPEAIRCDNKILVSGFAFSRALCARLGGFDETLPIYWDWDWYLRLHAAGVAFHDLGPQAVDDHRPPPRNFRRGSFAPSRRQSRARSAPNTGSDR